LDLLATGDEAQTTVAVRAYQDRLKVDTLVGERIWDFVRRHEVTWPIVMNGEAARGAVLKIL
jgi:hypothetical protein